MASERNKRWSGKFFVTGGPVLASYKTQLLRKALSCLRWPRIIVISVILADDFLQTCNITLMLSRHVGTIILIWENAMANIGKFVSTEL